PGLGHDITKILDPERTQSNQGQSNSGPGSINGKQHVDRKCIWSILDVLLFNTMFADFLHFMKHL
uniref:Uncharacterized protein n=1 Tax=Romanomermis culicivorax TaxID=13658 RepID=A0A915L5X8_ROMCU